MTLPGMELAAQIAVERVLNSLPEGLLIAAGAWLLLRVMGRQNAGTRFAVWMVALVSIAALPLLDSPAAAGSFSASAPNAALAIPGLWAMAFFAVWALAAFALLARLAAGVWQMKKIRRACMAVPLEDLPQTVQEPIRQARRPVQILISDEAQVPAAVGLWKPAVVLPAWALAELSEDDLRAIVVHEITHLQRRDDWTNLLQKAVRAVLFFHPAVWWIESRLSIEREMACDDAVLAATGNPRAYAGCLIGLLERGCARRGWTAAQAAVARARDAAQRIARILHPEHSASVRVGRVAPVAAVALSAACLGVAVCAPQLVVVAPAEPAAIATAAPPSTPLPAAAPAQAKVVRTAFVEAHAKPLRTKPAVEARHAARPLPAVLREQKKAAPRVEMASMDRVVSPAAEAAPQPDLQETAFYSRTVSTGFVAGAPSVVQTVTVRTVRYAGNGVAVQRTSVVQIVWVVPAQVVAETAWPAAI